jgi:predicted DsbA family dithiol-disulfide isomerase
MQIQIDVVSDLVCPWCYIGKRNLSRALEMVPDLACNISWRPYQLDPTLPPEGMDRQSYMERKFPDKGKLFAIQNSLMEAANAVDLVFNLQDIKITPNTLNAHRLVHWARGQGIDDLMVERLMSAYFIDGENLADQQTLVRLAVEAGLDADIIARLLAGDSDIETVQAEIESYRRMGVSAVPCFIFLGQAAMMGAQPPEALAGALRQIASAVA